MVKVWVVRFFSGWSVTFIVCAQIRHAYSVRLKQYPDSQCYEKFLWAMRSLNLVAHMRIETSQLFSILLNYMTTTKVNRP